MHARKCTSKHSREHQCHQVDGASSVPPTSSHPWSNLIHRARSGFRGWLSSQNCGYSAESQLWGGVFSCRWDGPLTLQPEEVQAVRWVDPRSDWQRAGEQYAPDSLEALARLLQHSSLELHA